MLKEKSMRMDFVKILTIACARSFNETDVTVLESTKAQAEDELSNENFESYKEDYPDR